MVTNAPRTAEIFHRFAEQAADGGAAPAQTASPEQTLILTGGGRTPSDALPGTFAELGQIDTLITDNGLQDAAADALRERLESLILAAPTETRNPR